MSHIDYAAEEFKSGYYRQQLRWQIMYGAIVSEVWREELETYYLRVWPEEYANQLLSLMEDGKIYHAGKAYQVQYYRDTTPALIRKMRGGSLYFSFREAKAYWNLPPVVVIRIKDAGDSNGK